MTLQERKSQIEAALQQITQANQEALAAAQRTKDEHTYLLGQLEIIQALLREEDATMNPNLPPPDHAPDSSAESAPVPANPSEERPPGIAEGSSLS
jgi:hypothetical protein